MKAVREIYELLKEFLEVALAGTVAFEFRGYLVQQCTVMNDQLKDMKFGTGINFFAPTSSHQAS